MGINIQEVDTNTIYPAQRKQMVTQQLIARDVRSKNVLGAMGKVPRQLFVEEAYREHAYDDNPLPIGKGQTISQPYMVAKNAELLDLHGTEIVLEIGAGCGYQAAILGMLSRQVVAMEWFEPLALKARATLKQLGFSNVEIVVGDGKKGYPTKAPYDRMLVSCAVTEIPAAWAQQMKQGGILVYPREDGGYQVLCRCVKGALGFEREEELFAVRFVPLL